MKAKQWRGRLSKAFIDVMEEVILVIGKDEFTRRVLVEKYDCGNFAAAIRLGRSIGKLRPKSVLELARRTDIDDIFSLDGIGERSVYVWMCILTVSGVNPDTWLGLGPKISTIYQKSRRRRKTKKLRQLDLRQLHPHGLRRVDSF